jgi:pyruvate dehydrogenase kinase 2/3/4
MLSLSRCVASVVSLGQINDGAVQELVNFPRPKLPEDIRKVFREAEAAPLPDTKPNPSLPAHMLYGGDGRGPNGRRQTASEHRCV